MSEETLGERLKRLRLAAGHKNRSAFARLCGFDRVLTWRYETGREWPTMPKVQRLAEVLNVDEIYLLTGHSTVSAVLEERASTQLKNLKSAIMRACIARRSLSEIQRIVSDA